MNYFNISVNFFGLLIDNEQKSVRGREKRKRLALSQRSERRQTLKSKREAKRGGAWDLKKIFSKFLVNFSFFDISFPFLSLALFDLDMFILNDLLMF